MIFIDRALASPSEPAWGYRNMAKAKKGGAQGLLGRLGVVPAAIPPHAVFDAAHSV